jgi:hypothetical protein
MPTTVNYQELVRRYGLEAPPKSVFQLTQLMARQDCDMDEITKVINKDPALSARLLRAANPGATDPAEYGVETVEQALMRNGLGCVMVLAMSVPLALALTKTFQTMLATKLQTVDALTVSPPDSDHVIGTIGFSGRAIGQVCLQVDTVGARWIASRILGLDPKELTQAIAGCNRRRSRALPNPITPKWKAAPWNAWLSAPKRPCSSSMSR